MRRFAQNERADPCKDLLTESRDRVRISRFHQTALASHHARAPLRPPLGDVARRKQSTVTTEVPRHSRADETPEVTTTRTMTQQSVADIAMPTSEPRDAAALYGGRELSVVTFSPNGRHAAHTRICQFTFRS